MQQQIQVLHPADLLPQINQLIDQPPDLIEHEPSLISEHYEEDFDPIQETIVPAVQPEIKEELGEEEEGKVLHTINHQALQQFSEAEEERLREECRLMQSQIDHIRAYLRERKQKQEQEEETHQVTPQTYQSLHIIKQHQEQQISKQKQQINTAIDHTLGRDTISAGFIILDQEWESSKFLEERLLQESVRLNALLHCSHNQIAKLRRQVKRNGQQLEGAEQQKEEMHRKYRQLYRQADEKREKAQRGEQKGSQLDTKLEELTQKINSLPVLKYDTADPDVSDLMKRWHQLERAKEIQQKKRALTLHSSVNSSNSLARNLLELRRQTQQVDKHIEQIQQTNLKLQEKSQQLLQSFQEEKKVRQHRYKQHHNHFTQSPFSQLDSLNFRSPSLSQAHHHISLPRRKNFSVQRKTNALNSYSNSHMLTNNPFIGLTGAALDAELSANDSLVGELQSKLKQCSTDGALRKQFKLRLPKNQLKNSHKYIQIKITNNNESNYSKKAPSKLSVSERIERIELLEKEDKVHSKTAVNPVVGLRGVERSKPNLSLHQPRPLETDMDMMPSFVRDQEAGQNPIRTRGVNKTVLDRTRTDLNSSSISNQRTKTSLPPQKHFSEIELPRPQKLFSSIQQKLEMRKSSAKISFQQEAPDQPISPEPYIENSSFNTSRLTRQSFILKKKGEAKQKRLTDDYMRLLEQKGRRILELDNEGDN